MKTVIHRADDRGYANHGWLQANHSFSFANFYDPEKVHFGALRVLNDDTIAPNMGFGTHPHNNMEIITIPLDGLLKHKDNMGDAWLSVKPGEVQVMSAGTGVQHSEINGSTNEHLKLFQIWIMPNKQNVAPRYDQKSFSAEDRNNKLQILVTSIEDHHAGSLKIHQDARISRIDMGKEKDLTYTLKSENHGVYIMVIDGVVITDNITLKTRDAVGISNVKTFEITAQQASSILFIEVPMAF